MLRPIHIIHTAALIFGILSAPAQASSSLVINGTIYKNDLGTTIDAWKFNILGTGTFTVDVAAYSASQNNVNHADYYTNDINGDGKLTWLDPDTYFYHSTGNPILATDAIFRCDDVQNNCGGATGASNYFNGYTPETSPLTRISRPSSEERVNGSIHFRRDPWYDVTVNTPGEYLFLMADFRLDPNEAEAGININDSFSAPSGFIDPILDHATYRVTFSSTDMRFSIDGDTITVRPVPVPGAIWFLGSALLGFAGLRRNTAS